MAKTKQAEGGEAAKKKASKSDSKHVEDEGGLMNEVAAFAAQLGLGSSRNGLTAGDDAFADFAPEKAKQRLQEGDDGHQKSHKAKKDEQKAQDRDAKGKGAQGKGSKPGTDKHHQEGDEEQQHIKEVPEEVLTRVWNAGAGPRPGEKQGKSLLGKDEPSIWYEASAALPPLPATTKQLGAEEVDKIRAHCEQLHENEVAAFEREMQRRNAADYRWLQQVKKSGTSADKVAAITLQVQESPVAGVRSLETLLGWVSRSKGGRDIVRQAIDALQELFTSVLLPDRRLKHLEQQPLAALPAGKEASKYLLYWYLEDQIKVRYNLYITALEECSRDNLDFVKDKAIKALYDLLVKKPEGEARLLSALVNKLGDPNRKLASKSGYLLTQLLLAHPVMKPIVAREVERFMFRPGLQDRACYYAVVFLNQLPLSHKESEGGPALAEKLVGLYFTLFKLIVDGKVGRAAAARKAQDERYRKERNAYLRAKQKQDGSGGGRQGRHAKHVANVGMKDKQQSKQLKPPKKPTAAVPEEMDARLLSALITGVRRAFPYINQEKVQPLVEQHSKDLFRLVHTAPFPVACQALMLMWQLMSAQDAVNDRFYRALYSALAHDALPTSSKGPMFLGLLFKAMKADTISKRCAAFCKRLLQCAAIAPPAFACAALLLLSEVLKAQSVLWTGITQPEDTGGAGAGSDEDGDETFKDIDDDDNDEAMAGSEDDDDEEEEGQGGKKGKSGRTAAGGKDGQGKTDVNPRDWPKPGYYDITKREPQYALAERACWWELDALGSHSHPSVAAFARTLLAGQHIVYAGDPLKDHALVTFLDKFIAKKPKAKVRGASVMQPVAGTVGQGGGAAAGGPGIGSDTFSALAESQVQPDEVFFHRFYTLQTVKARREAAKAAKHAKKQKKADGGSEEGSDDDAEQAGSEDDQEVDAFLDTQEGGVDDDLGDPDMGYDYDSLAEAMEEDEGLDGGSDDDDDDDEGEEEDGSDVSGGSDDEEEDAGSDDEAEEPAAGSKASKVAKGVQGSKSKVRTQADLSAAADVSDLDDSGDDDDDDFVMMDPADLKQQQQRAGKSHKKKGKQAAAADDDDHPDNDEVDALGVGILDLPSPSESESDDEGPGRKSSAKRKLNAKSFDFSDDGDVDGDDDDDDDDDGLQGSSGSDDVDVDDDGDDMSDDDDMMPGRDDDDDDEEEEVAGSKGKKGKQAKADSSRKRKADVFASADDYSNMMDDFMKKAKSGQQQQKGGASLEQAGGKAAGRGRGRGGAGGQGGRGGRGGRGEGGQRGRGGRRGRGGAR